MRWLLAAALLVGGVLPADAHSATGATFTPRKAVACGQDAYRIQPLYVSGSNQPDYYSLNRPRAVNDLMTADDFLSATAKGEGGDAHLRLVTDTACNILIPDVRAHGPVGTLGDAINAARAAGYGTNGYRVWLIYAQTGSGQCAGVATGGGSTRSSDIPDPTLNASLDPAESHYAATSCLNQTSDWSVVLHEITHSLGAVQPGAPHSTGRGHCNDGADIMCYDDGGPTGRQQSPPPCSTQTYDCGQDDYFSLHPRGSWLPTHWNVASSWFLQVTR